MVISFSEEQARLLAASVSVDTTEYSVSFNEFLKLMSMQNQSEPDEETLVDMFQSVVHSTSAHFRPLARTTTGIYNLCSSFDKDDVGMIAEDLFKKIMRSKDDINDEDITEMLEEYYR